MNAAKAARTLEISTLYRAGVVNKMIYVDEVVDSSKLYRSSAAQKKMGSEHTNIITILILVMVIFRVP